MTCNYCGAVADLVSGEVIYPHRHCLWGKMFWRCEPCKAWVGCHPGTITPLGTLANAELRHMRNRAHEAFDPIWDSGQLARTQAYHWLANRMGMRKEDVRIGQFNLAQCQRVIDECSQFRQDNKQ
jgi:hypothetical protein